MVKEDGRSTIHTVACTTLLSKRANVALPTCGAWDPCTSVEIITDEIGKPMRHLVFGLATNSMHEFLGIEGFRPTRKEEDSSPRRIEMHCV